MSRSPSEICPGRVRPRAVRGVAVELRAPVDRDEHAVGDLDVARNRVRQRAVRARGDDRRERRALGAHAAHLRLEIEGDLLLGAPRETAPQHGLERGVREQRRGADARDLLRVLDHPQVLDEAARRDELDVLGREPLELGVLLDRHVVVVEAEPHGALGGQPADRGLQEVLHDLALPGAVELLLGLAEVPEVREEPARVRTPMTAVPDEPVKPVSQRTLTRWETSRRSSSRSASAAVTRSGRSVVMGLRAPG